MRSSGRLSADAACARANATHAKPARRATLGTFRFTGRPVKFIARERHINKRPGKRSRSMKLISWNIQWCRACDGRVDPARIGRVAREMADFDVLCLQEIASNYPDLAGSSGENQYAALAGLFPDYSVVKGVATDVPAPHGDRRKFGNAIVTRLPVLQVFRRLLPWPADPSETSMKRSAVEVVLESPS